jgi:hypothetical protein
MGAESVANRIVMDKDHKLQQVTHFGDQLLPERVFEQAADTVVPFVVCLAAGVKQV